MFDLYSSKLSVLIINRNMSVFSVIDYIRKGCNDNVHMIFIKKAQRVLNAIEPGSVVPIHRHQKTSETVVVVRGRVVEEYYDDARNCVAKIELSAGGPASALNIPAGQWHTLHAMESGTVILEMKDGAYEAIQPEDIMTI